jgi:hypothetical protein
MIGCGIREKKTVHFGAGGFLRRNEACIYRMNCPTHLVFPPVFYPGITKKKPTPEAWPVDALQEPFDDTEAISASNTRWLDAACVALLQNYQGRQFQNDPPDAAANRRTIQLPLQFHAAGRQHPAAGI